MVGCQGSTPYALAELGVGKIILPTGLPAHSCLCVLCLQLVDFWCPLGPPVRVAAFCSVIDRVAAALNAESAPYVPLGLKGVFVGSRATVTWPVEDGPYEPFYAAALRSVVAAPVR